MKELQKQDRERNRMFNRKALEARKNRRAMQIGVPVLAAAAAVFLLWKGCGEEGPCSDVRRADGQCAAACEARPFRIHPDGRKMTDSNGNPVPNPYYSWEDCHDTDMVCHDDLSKVKNLDGTPYRFVEKDAFGRSYTPQPESANPNDPNFSIDCARIQCGSQCGDDGKQICPTISERPLIGPNTKVRRLVWDPETQQEVVRESPASPYMGLEDFTDSGLVGLRAEKGTRILTSPIVSENWRIWNYEEMCPGDYAKRMGKNAPVVGCTPLSEGPCVCSNHSKCQPGDAPPPPAAFCGDGKVNGGEQCDSSSGQLRGGCGTGYTCRTSKEGRYDACTCKREKQEPSDVCGDGQVTGREQCDTSSTLPNKGCSEGQTCENCRCKTPPAPALGPCPAEVQGMAQAKDLRDTVRGIYRENAGALRRKLGAISSDRVDLSTRLIIEGGKVIGITGIGGSCTGTCSGQSLSKSDILGITGSLDVLGEAAPQTRSKCFIPVTYNPRE